MPAKAYTIYDIFKPYRRLKLFKTPRQNEKPISKTHALIFTIIHSFILLLSHVGLDAGFKEEWSIRYFSSAVQMRLYYTSSFASILNFHLTEYSKLRRVFDSIQVLQSATFGTKFSRISIILILWVTASLIYLALLYASDLLSMEINLELPNSPNLELFLIAGSCYYYYMLWNTLGLLILVTILLIISLQFTAIAELDVKKLQRSHIFFLHSKAVLNAEDVFIIFGLLVLGNILTIFVNFVIGVYTMIRPLSDYNLKTARVLGFVGFAILIALLEAGGKVCYHVSKSCKSVSVLAGYQF